MVNQINWTADKLISNRSLNTMEQNVINTSTGHIHDGSDSKKIIKTESSLAKMDAGLIGSFNEDEFVPSFLTVATLGTETFTTGMRLIITGTVNLIKTAYDPKPYVYLYIYVDSVEKAKVFVGGTGAWNGAITTMVDVTSGAHTIDMKVYPSGGYGTKYYGHQLNYFAIGKV